MLAHEITKGHPQGIVTFLDTEADKILKDFRCPCCGRIVFQYYGGIKLMMPGEVAVPWIDIVGAPKPIQCKNKRRIDIDGREVIVKCKTVFYVIG